MYHIHRNSGAFDGVELVFQSNPMLTQNPSNPGEDLVNNTTPALGSMGSNIHMSHTPVARSNHHSDEESMLKERFQMLLDDYDGLRRRAAGD